MAGLLQQGMQPAAPERAPQSPPAQETPSPGGGDPRIDMDPEQGVQMRDELINAMLDTLYGELSDDAAELLKQYRNNPTEGVGRLVFQLVMTVWQAVTEEGATIPPGVLFQAAMVAAQAVGEMAIEMGMLDAEDGDSIEDGFMSAMAQFGQATREQMPPEQRRRYQELLMAMDESKQMAMGGQAQPDQPQQPTMPPGGAS